jgi:hypothetical protein
MEIRKLTPLVFTLLAALAVLYPVTTATRPPAQASTQASGSSHDKSDSASTPPANQNFPLARDLVSEFLFSNNQSHPPSPSPAKEPGYSIDFLIATVPEPISSRLPHFFDGFVESLQSAAEASGYTLDRFALPWVEKEDGARDDSPLWQTRLFESVPGLILLRNPQDRKLLLIFLVGETPTTGIHKQAMFSALDQTAQFYSWDPKHAELPAGFPQVSDPAAALRIMGPSFSGSAMSLRFVIDKWSDSRGNPPAIRFRIISGTATAIDSTWLSQAAGGHASFQATVPPDAETLQAVACYVGELGYSKIAILTESNTAYGQNATNQTVKKKGGSGQTQGACEDGQSAPDIISLPFPMDISRLRVAASVTTPQQAAGSGTASSKPISRHLSQQGGAEPREVIPSFSDLTVQSAELTLANLLSTIAREQYSYVGIVATDVRDATFLAREAREHCPATVLFTLNSDLLYAYPDVNSATRGMVIATPYPLFNLEQLWTYAYGGDKKRLQFANQAAEGVYNATLALLNQDSGMVDYGTPLAAPSNPQAIKQHKPALWLTAIGSGESLPIRLLDWKDDGNYTYSPPSAAGTRKSSGKLSVGRGIYAENSVVAVIALNLFLAAISLMTIIQYWRPEKRGTGQISELLGDPASTAYWSECRLFLLCAAMSLLSLFLVVLAAFCLPFMTAKVLGSSLQTTLTPRIAAILAIVTLTLLLLAVHTLISALRKAPHDQRGSAPEVVFFALFGCAVVFLLASILGISWLESVNLWPAIGLFIHLRSFDLGGGLSPLLPLTCVALGACFWALCSFRRLRLLDVLRAMGTVEKSQPWLSFLSLDVPSFSGVRELENSIKHILESSSVISLRWYSLLLAVTIMVGHYFFDTRLVRALEPRPFYWLFEVAFIIVYWALLMEFLRMVFAWRSLHLLLRRLSWHPMLAAFKRYRGCRPNLAKMNLTHPPSSFAALECSTDQARRLMRSANALAVSSDIDQGLRESLRESIPMWETHVEGAAAQLREALRLEWTDSSRAEKLPPADPSRPKMRASRIQGNWRQSLKSLSHAHLSLFRIAQLLAKPLEEHWTSTRMEAAHPAPAAKEFFDQAEEFIVGRAVNFLAIVLPSLQNLGYFVLAGLLLMLLAVTSYPFQPRNEFLFFNWVVILSFVGTVFWIFMQMDRDTIFSLLNDTVPGQISFSRELVLRMLLYVAVPLMALLGAQFPESLRQILSIFTAAQGSSS